MLRLGLDFYDTVDKSPKLFKKLANAVLASGGSVYIISAVMEGNEKRLIRDVQRSHLPHTKLFIVTYTSFGEVPKKKKQIIKSLGLDFYIDDSKRNLSAIKDLKVIPLHMFE